MCTAQPNVQNSADCLLKVEFCWLGARLRCGTSFQGLKKSVFLWLNYKNKQEKQLSSQVTAGINSKFMRGKFLVKLYLYILRQLMNFLPTFKFPKMSFLCEANSCELSLVN